MEELTDEEKQAQKQNPLEGRESVFDLGPQPEDKEHADRVDQRLKNRVAR